MARYTGSVCRLCRREGMKLFLKGAKCYTEKCPVSKRTYAPGQHGQGRMKKLSNYGLQLREKQKVKRTYGVLERQFKRYFHIAERAKGVTGEKLLQQLEHRLDNVMHRLGFASSRAQGRQLVRHCFVAVNGRRVTIPSYSVRAGDVVQVIGSESGLKMVRQVLEQMKDRSVPSWLELNADDLRGKVLRPAQRADIQMPVQEQLIVELYSK